jgi:hypothetical protein
MEESQPPQPHRFASEEMLKCEACQRANAPTRSSCLYCGAALPQTEASAALQRPALRPLEKWERGYNTVVAPRQSELIGEDALTELASLLRLDRAELRRILSSEEVLPVCRAATAEEASLVERKLKALGLRRVWTVADEDLRTEELTPKRVRAIELTEEALVLHPTGGGAPGSLKWDEVLLFIVGRLMVRRVSIEERRGSRRREEQEILSASETHEDEAVLDIYSAETGWRIAAAHFDFSCLGERKGLVAARNFPALVHELRKLAPRAGYDDSYRSVRGALSLVWKPEQSVEARGLKRERPGKYSTETMTTSGNEAQLTRYSLLRLYLRLHDIA